MFPSTRRLAFQSFLIVDLNSSPQPDGSLRARLGSKMPPIKKKNHIWCVQWPSAKAFENPQRQQAFIVCGRVWVLDMMVRLSELRHKSAREAGISRSKPVVLLLSHLWWPRQMRPRSAWPLLAVCFTFLCRQSWRTTSVPWCILHGSQGLPCKTEPHLLPSATSSVTFGLAFLLPGFSLPTMAFPGSASPKQQPAWKTTFAGAQAARCWTGFLLRFMNELFQQSLAGDSHLVDVSSGIAS